MTGDVKALINLKDGTIQLEGPQVFVEKYLEQYKNIIMNAPLHHKSAENPIITEKDVKDVLPKKTRITRSKSSGPTCGEKIRELVGEGYFKEPKTLTEIAEYLKSKKGVIYTSKELSANLKNMFDRGQIKRISEDGVFKYYINL